MKYFTLGFILFFTFSRCSNVDQAKHYFTLKCERDKENVFAPLSVNDIRDIELFGRNSEFHDTILIDSLKSIIIRAYSTIEKYHSDSLYLPIRGEKRLQTAIFFQKINGKWDGECVNLSHDLNDIEYIANEIYNFLLDYDKDGSRGLKSLVIPIRYWKKSQLKAEYFPLPPS